MSTRVELRLLKRLNDSDERGISESEMPKSCLPMLKRLQDCDCIRRVQHVRGAVYVVCDRAVLARYISTAAPLGLENDSLQPTSRADAVLLLGNAKSALRSDCFGVFIRSTSQDIALTSSSGTIAVSELTRIAGGAALLLDDKNQWSLSGATVAIIENAEAFWHHERVLPQVDLAIWTMGRMSGRRLLAWLASPSMHHCRYIHWGDYDPIGAAEYLRLCNACPGRASMWMPDDLESLLKRHGKTSLLRKKGNQRVYHRLRGRTDDPTVVRLIQLFDRYGVGLEQEILLSNRG